MEENRICVVIKEIESWYLAGLNEEASHRFGIRNLKDTNTINKEKFERIMPQDFDSKTDFMREILKFFSIETARTKNTSFKYFYEKHVENSV